MTFAHVIITAIALTGCLWDLQTRRIPNYLTFGGATLGVLYALVTGGWQAAAVSAAGWAVGLILFIPFFLLRGLGGGDVKLLAALGAWFGPAGMLVLAFYTAVAGGLLALVVVLFTGYFSTAFKNLWLLLCHWRVTGLKAVPDISLDNPHSRRLPYGVAIAAGAVTTLWLH
jgi:prepilin peptidase CpaA